MARAGSDLTIATIGKSVSDALAAAETLAAEGVSAEVIDLRSLRPLDVGTVLESVSRTNRLLVDRGGAADRRLGRRPGRRRGRGRTPRPRRRVAADHRRDPDPVQPHARGRVHSRHGAILATVRERAGLATS